MININNETLTNFHQLEINPILTKIKKLQSDRGYRDKKRLFFAEGIRNFVEAVDHNFSIDALFYSEKLLICPIARKLVRRLKREGVAFARVSPEQFRIVSLTERASGIAAIFHQQVQRLNQINPSDHICWTVLNQICSLGNLGTLLRTSAATGSSGFILIGDSIDPFDPKVVRATMGAIFKQTIVKTTAEELRHWIKKHKLAVVGASPKGSMDYNQVSYQQPTILMLGNERAGLSQEQESMCQQIVRIPMAEGTDSLNVAIAGSLILYEVFKSSLNKNRLGDC
ncbi:MAG: RNA methyltransferase [Acidobacteria bacterium]|nr:RNA methyltransferase [Acidobacteriota bacterium]